MPVFKMKPIVVEAAQFVSGGGVPEWLQAAIDRREVSFTTGIDGHATMTLISSCRVEYAAWGDWIVRGPDNTLSVCKPHVFDFTFEPVE